MLVHGSEADAWAAVGVVVGAGVGAVWSLRRGMKAHAVVGTEVDMVFFLADVMLTCGSELASTQTVELPGSGAGVGFVWALV